MTDGRWNAAKAVAMYVALEKTLARTYPEHAARPHAKWVVLEDNDPAGYKASAAKRKKAEFGISVMALPPRSIWSEINRRLRRREASFPEQKKESKAAFLK